jgi:REP element-mobilizing transposase RayT
MARPLRIQAPGLTYHVVARGVRRTSIYVDEVDRHRFLKLLADVIQRYALLCHAYCEMTNHYHLAVTTTEANLSRAVQRLNSRYAQWWNWRHDRSGHVFQSRFNSQVIQDDAYLLNVCRYIVLNPVRARVVGSPEEWPWSSYRATVGLERSPPFLDCQQLMAAAAPEDPADGPNRFRLSLMQTDVLALQFPRAAIVGDEAFITRFRALRARASREVPGREGRPSLDAVFQGAITRCARNKAIETALRERYAAAEVARYLGLHPSTVSRIASDAGLEPSARG